MLDRKLYTRSGKVLFERDIVSLPSVGQGTFGDVYDYGDGKVIKILPEPSVYCSYQIMATIKRLKLFNFYRIYDILSSKKSEKKYVGCITSYHIAEPIDILEMPSEWLIENYEKLYEDMIKIGEAKIAIYDTVPCNCIINSSGITIIDTDRYKERTGECVEENIRSFNDEFLRPLLWKYCIRFHSDKLVPDEIKRILGELIESFLEDKSVLSKTLSRYPKPIDCIVDRIKK